MKAWMKGAIVEGFVDIKLNHIYKNFETMG